TESPSRSQLDVPSFKAISTRQGFAKPASYSVPSNHSITKSPNHSIPMDSTKLITELVAIPGPPGYESDVRDAVAAHVASLGFEHSTDAKGNLLVRVSEGAADSPSVVVTAHLDELG